MEERRIAVKMTDIHPFTERQAEVIETYINAGSRAKAARQLGISEGTLKQHVHHILDTMEDVTGKRPAQRCWGAELIGDVVFPTDA